MASSSFFFFLLWYRNLPVIPLLPFPPPRLLSPVQHVCFTLFPLSPPFFQTHFYSMVIFHCLFPLSLPPSFLLCYSTGLCRCSSSSHLDSEMYIKAQPHPRIADLWHLTDKVSLGTQDSHHEGNERPRGGRLLSVFALR